MTAISWWTTPTGKKAHAWSENLDGLVCGASIGLVSQGGALAPSDMARCARCVAIVAKWRAV